MDIATLSETIATAEEEVRALTATQGATAPEVEAMMDDVHALKRERVRLLQETPGWSQDEAHSDGLRRMAGDAGEAE